MCCRCCVVWCQFIATFSFTDCTDIGNNCNWKVTTEITLVSKLLNPAIYLSYIICWFHWLKIAERIKCSSHKLLPSNLHICITSSVISMLQAALALSSACVVHLQHHRYEWPIVPFDELHLVCITSSMLLHHPCLSVPDSSPLPTTLTSSSWFTSFIMHSFIPSIKLLFHKWRVHPSSHLDTIDMGQKWDGVDVPFFLEVAGSPSNTKSPEPTPTFIPSGILVYRAAWPQRTMAENWGLCPFMGGELGPHLTQCRVGRRLPAYQAASWSMQPFGHNTRGPKIGGSGPFWGGEDWVPI